LIWPVTRSLDRVEFKNYARNSRLRNMLDLVRAWWLHNVKLNPIASKRTKFITFPKTTEPLVTSGQFNVVKWLVVQIKWVLGPLTDEFGSSPLRMMALQHTLTLPLPEHVFCFYSVGSKFNPAKRRVGSLALFKKIWITW